MFAPYVYCIGSGARIGLDSASFTLDFV
jgi:hypothetical protein